MSAIRCFVLEPTGVDRVYLRRYARHDSACPEPRGYHDASSYWRELPSERVVRDAEPWERALPGWPTHCACGYAFSEDDHWQIRREAQYRGVSPTLGEVLCTLDAAPPGAMWRQTWFEEHRSYLGPDGQNWCLMTPGGPWNIDGPNRSSSWERSGTAPLLTAHPSIVVLNPDGSERYHGWLTEGVLTPV